MGERRAGCADMTMARAAPKVFPTLLFLLLVLYHHKVLGHRVESSRGLPRHATTFGLTRRGLGDDAAPGTSHNHPSKPDQHADATEKGRPLPAGEKSLQATTSVLDRSRWAPADLAQAGLRLGDLSPMLQRVYGARHDFAQPNPFRSVANVDNQAQKVALPGRTRFVAAAEGRPAVTSSRPSDHCALVFMPGKGMVCTVLRDFDGEAAAKDQLKKTIKIVKQHRGKAPLAIRTYHPSYTGNGEASRRAWLAADTMQEQLKKGLKAKDEDLRATWQPGTLTGLPDHMWNRIGDPQTGQVHEVKVEMDRQGVAQRLLEREQVEDTFDRPPPPPARAPGQGGKSGQKAAELRQAYEAKRDGAQEAKKAPPYKLEQRKE